MKVLTIKNPWATLIVDNYKTYEFRSWKTNYRGKILIHSSKIAEKDTIDRFKDYNLTLINGAIIGEAIITDCILVDENFNEILNKKDHVVYGKSNHVANYAWKLEDIKKYDKPIYVKGKLGLWELEVEHDT